MGLEAWMGLRWDIMNIHGFDIQCVRTKAKSESRTQTDIPYSRKFWREEYLADCSNNGIWQILLWRLDKLYTIIIFIAKW